MASSKPIRDIEDILEKQEYGEGYIQFKRSQGRTVQVIIPQYHSVRYDSNEKAIEAINNALRVLLENSDNGSFTFTVNKKGDTIKEIIYQGLEQRNYG